jgi:hypothetical protein
MSRWFRMYDEILDDPKVQRLPPDLFKAWVNILALTSRNDGALPSMENCCFAFRETENSVSSAFHALEKVGLLKRKNGRLIPNGWEKRQYKSDTSTDRVKRFRDRFRNAAETPSESESESESIPSESKILQESKTRARKFDSDFAEWWAVYPDKVGKGAARKAYQGARSKGVDQPTLMAALPRYIAAKPPDRAWCHPATWLNQERWLDQPAPPPAGRLDAALDRSREIVEQMEEIRCRTRMDLQPPLKLATS